MKRVQPTIMQPQHNTIMRRVIQPRDNSQSLNAVNKVSNLSNVTVSPSNSPRVIRQTIYASPQIQSNIKCFICDENIMGSPTSLKETETSTSREKVTKKLARLVGDEFCVIVSEEDVICRRCLTLFNTMDKYESDIQNVKTRLKGFINKKYGIEEPEEPPVKIQRLNEQQSSAVTVHSNNNNNNNYRWQNNSIDESPTRKVPASVSKETAESQLKHLANSKQRGPVKLYKCIACDFKTTDLNAFQPHSSVCKGQQQQQQQTKPNTIISPQNRVNRVAYQNSPQQQQQQQQKAVSSPISQQVGRTTIIRSSNSSQFSCQQCEFKTNDRNLFAEHQRNHMKLRPFKCRMCLERFATREAAQTHAKIHSGNGMKCGICNRQFIKREVFEAHMKTHEKFKTVSQQEVIVMNKSNENIGTVQKPLTDIIKEALSEEDQDGVNEFIEFHSCNLCSLTFVNKKLYAQHMKTHESPSTVRIEDSQTTYGKNKSQITEGDLESIFEKMHSENVTISNGSNNGNENILITTQDSGGITYNITIPQDDIPHEEKKVRIDMPNLDDTGDDSHKNETEQTHQRATVSMPSLHDDENTQSSQEQQQSSENQQGDQGQAIPMDLEELQQAAEGQQLKFIVDENGQFLQLDNHILTTDAEGNQILVQGTNQEQLQHLLQSVGVDGNQVLVQLQGNGEGIDEGATLQFGEGGQGQMILVQNENGESQLIDASMLQTEGGNLVLQQGADGETTLTTADGIPVSVSFAGDGNDGQITVTMAGTGEDGQQIFIQQPVELSEGQEQVSHEGETAMQVEENSQDTSTAPENNAEADNQTATTEEKIVLEVESNNDEKSKEVEATVDNENKDSALNKDDEKESIEK